MARTQTWRETANPLRAWFGMVGAPIIWFVHFVIVWALGEFGCGAGLADDTVLTDGSLKLFVLVATVIGLIGTFASTFVAYQIWQQYRQAAPQSGDTALGRQRFMALTGMALGILFTIVVILDALPVLFVSTCGSVAGA